MYTMANKMMEKKQNDKNPDPPVDSRRGLQLSQLGAAVAHEVGLSILDAVTVHVDGHVAAVAVHDGEVVVVRRPVETYHANLQYKSVSQIKRRKIGRKREKIK